MGREISPEGLLIEGKIIRLDSLLPISEALTFCNISLYKMLNEMSRRDDLDSYPIGGTRYIPRVAVERLKADLDNERRKPQAKVLPEPQADRPAA